MRKKMLVFVSVLVLALAAPLAGGATPAAAHPDHTACTGGVVAAIEMIDDQEVFPHGPGKGIDGDFISAGASSGPGVLAAGVDGIHQVPLCTPK